jgi:ribonuclease BN (tRNA processing enzyme)
MKLTILGNNGPYPSAGGACSGYLIQDDKTNILIDCGNGVLSNLFKIIPFEKLDAIILTHLHSDHMSDMMVLRYAVQIKMNKGMINKQISVYAPSEPAEEYNRLDSKGIFDLKTINSESELQFGNLKFTFKEMKHPMMCFAVSIFDGVRRFVFSGDTAWNENIIEFSRNADLAMLDAGLLTKDKTNENVPHLTAEECGIIAGKADVKRLMLTHFWPDYDRNELLREAKAKFDNVILSELMKTYEI